MIGGLFFISGDLTMGSFVAISTYAGNNTVYGDNGNDIINTGDGNDSIYGGDGNDTLNAGTGNDIIYGGSGDDVIDAGAGDDVIYGNQGDDYYYLIHKWGNDLSIFRRFLGMINNPFTIIIGLGLLGAVLSYLFSDVENFRIWPVCVGIFMGLFFNWVYWINTDWFGIRGTWNSKFD